MLKAAEVEIKKEHKLLMVNKTTSFKKKGNERRGTSRQPSVSDVKSYLTRLTLHFSLVLMVVCSSPKGHML